MAPQQLPTDSPEPTPESQPEPILQPVDNTPDTDTTTVPNPPSEPPAKEAELQVDDNGFVPEPALDSELNAINNEFQTNEQQPATAPLVPKKSNKKLLIIIAAVVVALLGGGAATYAFWYNTPDKAVTDAVAKMMVATSGTSEGVLTFENKDTDSAKIKLDYQLGVNETSASISSKLDVVMNAKTTTINSNVVMAKEGLAVKLDNFRDLSKTILEQVGVNGTDAEMFDGLIEKIDNKWVVITAKDFEEFSGNRDTDEQATCAMAALAIFRKSDSQQREVMKVYENNRFIVSSASKATETVNGKLSNRYEITVDETKADAFSEKIMDTTVFKAVDDCYDGDLRKQYTDTKDDVRGDTESKTTSKTELWVDVMTHEPTKVRLTADSNESSMVLESSISLNKASQITFPQAQTTLKDLQSEIESIQTRMMSGYEDSEFDPSVLGIRSFN